MARYRRVTDVTSALDEEFGLAVSDRTLYAIERGEQIANAELMLALLLLYAPPGGMTFFLPSVHPDCRERLAAMLRG